MRPTRQSLGEVCRAAAIVLRWRGVQRFDLTVAAPSVSDTNSRNSVGLSCFALSLQGARRRGRCSVRLQRWSGVPRRNAGMEKLQRVSYATRRHSHQNANELNSMRACLRMKSGKTQEFSCFLFGFQRSQQCGHVLWPFKVRAATFIVAPD